MHPLTPHRHRRPQATQRGPLILAIGLMLACIATVGVGWVALAKPPQRAVLQVTAASDVTAGVAGVLGSASIQGTDGGHVQTTDAGLVAGDAGSNGADATFVDTDGGFPSPVIAGPVPAPYPCKPAIVVTDNGAASATLACTSGSVTCLDQAGALWTLPVTSISETPKTLAKVCKDFIGATATGCSGGSDSSDKLRVYCAANWVGLDKPGPTPLYRDPAKSIAGVCYYDLSAGTTNCEGGGVLTINTDYDPTNAALDCGAIATDFSITPARGDECWVMDKTR